MNVITSPTIHTFDDSGEAYDASQWRDDIVDGDVLACADGVVGVLCAAWPVAVSSERGSFHELDMSNGATWSCVRKHDDDPGTDYSASRRLALWHIAKRERYSEGDVVVLYGHADGENGPHPSDVDQPMRVASVLELDVHSARPDWVLRYRVSERCGERHDDVDVHWINAGAVHRLYVPELDDERAS